jgi:hypothetical protein
MAQYQLGSNLYGNDNGQYYSLQNGSYIGANGQKQNGQVKVYQDSPWSTSQNQINGLYGAQQKQQLGALKQQQQTALAGLNQQQKVSDQGFYGQRNQADVTNAQNVQHMREVMAQNGLNMSGENITATAGLNAQRQAAFNDINQKQADANAQFDQQRSSINDPQHAQDIIDQINAQKSQALLNAWNTYMSRLDNQHQQYVAGQQFDATQAQNQRQFDASQSQNQNQFDATQAFNKYQLDQTNAYKAGAAGFNNGSGGGGGTAAFNTNLAAANKQGVPAADNAALTWLVQHESGFNPNAKNPTSTAYGYGQFLTATRRQYEKETGLSYNDPVGQLVMMDQYVKDRYGSAANAVKFWQKNHWY